MRREAVAVGHSRLPHAQTCRMKKIIPFLLFFLTSISSLGQNVGIKSNIISDALLNPSLGLEVGVAPRWSLDLTGQVNYWNQSHDRKWKHWMVQPEARYWLCRAMDGHFFAAHLVGGEYNIGHLDIPFSMLGSDFRRLKDRRFQGWMAGIGLGYGYSWTLSRHFDIEAEIGLGYVFSRYDVYECAGCGRKTESGKHHNYVGPTKAALNLVYVF